MIDTSRILHGLRDRDTDSRIALRRIAERCERAEARVKELETALLAGIERCRESTVSPLGRQVVEQASMEMRIALGDRAEARGMIDSKKLAKAEARGRELEAERDRMREALVEALRLLDELNYSTTNETADLLRQIGNIGEAEIIIRAALAGGRSRR